MKVGTKGGGGILCCQLMGIEHINQDTLPFISVVGEIRGWLGFDQVVPRIIEADLSDG